MSIKEKIKSKSIKSSLRDEEKMLTGGMIKKVKIEVPGMAPVYATVQEDWGSKVKTDQGDFEKKFIVHEFIVDSRHIKETGGEVGESKLNKQGGYNYEGKDKKTAEKVGLITLPEDVKGTNCGNCIFFSSDFCHQKKIKLPVTSRMCCSFWDAKELLNAITDIPNTSFSVDKKQLDSTTLNENGGLDYSESDINKAKDADLITLPKDVWGTNCGNCQFVKDGNCLNKNVQLPVTERMSCSLWNHPEVKRTWGDMKEVFFKNGGSVKTYLTGGEVGTPKWTEEVISKANIDFDLLKMQPVAEDYVRYIREELKLQCENPKSKAEKYYKDWLLTQEATMLRGGKTKSVKSKLLAEAGIDGKIKVKTPRKEYIISVGDITANEAIETVKEKYENFVEFEYKKITYKKTGKKGEFIKRVDPPENIEARWKKKKDGIRQLSENIKSLRNTVSRDLNSDDEKTALTALVVAIMDKTAERPGNDESASYVKQNKNDKRKKAYGVTGFKQSHVTVLGNKVHLNYIGKKGVPQEKSFSDDRIAKALKKAIKNCKGEFIFETNNCNITAGIVNEYLKPYHVTAKNIRGYSANRWVLDKLKSLKPEDSDKKRKKQLNIVLKQIAERVGHGPSVLKNQYLMPEVIDTWIDKGELFDMKKAGYVMRKGGSIKSQLAKGVKVEHEHKDLYDKLKARLKAEGVKMPMKEQEFYETIAKAHLREEKDYYDLLMKYVEKKENGGKIMSVESLKQRIESETGLKVSVRKGALSGSMRGYITFMPRKKGETYPNFDFAYARKLQEEMPGVEPHPNFFTVGDFVVYFGNEIYNEPKTPSKPEIGKSETVEEAKKVMFPLYKQIDDFDADIKIGHTQIDWGNKSRGQGRRSGHMVKGSMSDAPHGIKSYPYVDWSMYPEVASDIDHMKHFTGIESERYVRARQFGANHIEAKVYAIIQKTKENGGVANSDDFANSEKNSNFVITKTDIQNVISGKSKISNGEAIQAASTYLRRNAGANPKSEDPEFCKRQEAEQLRKYADQNNFWFTGKLDENKRIDEGEGAEQRVYRIDSKNVLKLNNLAFYNSWEDYFHNLLLHNYFFPDTSYELIGFMDEDNILYPVIKQAFIEETEKTDLSSVKKFMADNGFYNTRRNDYENKTLGLILEDLHDGNVLTKDGTLYFIDTVFYVKDKFYAKYENGGITSSDNEFIYKAIKLPKYQDLTIREAKILYDKFKDKEKLKKTSEGEYYIEAEMTQGTDKLIKTPMSKIFEDLEKKGYGYIIQDDFTASDKLFEYIHAVRMYKNNLEDTTNHDDKSVSVEAQKQIDDYIKEGSFITKEDNPVVGVLPISRFNGSDADIHPNQTSVSRSGVEKWKKRIQAGERPYVLIDYVNYLNENRVKDGHHRLKAYEDFDIDIIPVIDVNGKILNEEKYSCGCMADGGKVKKVIRRNLPIDREYKLIDSFYTGGIEENPMVCDNCDRPIANVAVIEDQDGKKFNVGMDCAETLASIKNSMEFNQATHDFNEANALRAKIRNANKKNPDTKIIVANTYWGNISIEMRNNKDNLIFSGSHPKEFFLKHLPDLSKNIINPEKNTFFPKYIDNYNLGYDYHDLKLLADKEPKKINIDSYTALIEVKSRTFTQRDGSIGTLYDYAIKVYSGDKLIGEQRVPMAQDVATRIIGTINKYEFENFVPSSEVKMAVGGKNPVVDKVLYHGTQIGFDKVKSEQEISNPTYGGVIDNSLGKFFTNNKTMAGWFGGVVEFDANSGKYKPTKNKNARVLEERVRLYNPYVIDSTNPEYDIDNDKDSVQIYFDEIEASGDAEKYKKKLLSKGYDGIVLKGNTTNYYEDGKTYDMYVVFDDVKMAVGGTINAEKQAEAEQLAKKFLESLSEDQITGLRHDVKNAVDSVIKQEEKKLFDLEAKQEALNTEEKPLFRKHMDLPYGPEKDQVSQRRQEIYRELSGLKSAIRNQQNIVKAIKNGGDMVSFTDKKGLEHKSIPVFSEIKSDLIAFDEETILAEDVPMYIPVIDEEKFKDKGYIFDAIRISSDKYILAVNGFNEKIESDAEQGYVITTLDQLALINDYYFTKAKAIELKKAEEKSKRNEEYYDKLPREKREKHLNQVGFYTTLPVAVKKKISKENYEALSLEEKEKLYKPFKKYGSKRLVSKLEDTQMWRSFHEMYERFINPEALPIDKTGATVKHRGFGTFGNPETFEYWYAFRDMMKWKIKDIQVQREVDSEVRKIALETSFGESNTNDTLKEKYGILVKRQDGSKIMPEQIEQIRNAWENVNKIFGNVVHNAREVNFKVSHTGVKYVFASRAVGMFVPNMKTIAVSNKYGDSQFQCTMAHETAHWIDYSIGHLKGKRYATDDFESPAGLVASTFRENMNAKSDSDYINATTECFARAMEQYFAFETIGEDAHILFSYGELKEAITYSSEDKYVSKEKFNDKIKPLIKAFLEENKSWFQFGIETVKMLRGGKMSESDIIARYNLYGKDIKVRFENDSKLYFTKNISYDRKAVFVIDSAGVTTNKKIKNIVEIGGNKIKFEQGGKLVTSDGSQGGMFTGPSHANGGMPTIVSGTGERIEVEGREPLIVPAVLSIKKKMRCVGKPKSVLSTLNQIGGGANFSEEQAQCTLIDDEEEADKMELGNKIDEKKPITEISGDVVTAPAGSAVINKTSTAIQDTVICEGTPGGMASAINEIGGHGVHFADHGSCTLIKNQLNKE